MNSVILPFLLILAGYLLGSLSGSLLLGRLRRVDIRQHGSGNAGGTNAFRTLGWRFALGVVLVDAGKGALAAWLGARFAPAGDVGIWTPWLVLAAAVLGHVWPIYHGFRGGKGVGTMLGGLLVLWPQAVLAFVLVWLLVLVASGYVGLSSICSALGLAAFGAFTTTGPSLWFAMTAAVFVVFTHRQNLLRLRRGNEHRFDRARLWRR